MHKLTNVLLASREVLSTHYLNRYINFISSCRYSDDEYTERHHYLPQSLFPEYSKSDSNIVILSGRQHYIAHYILAKAFGGSMWFAFNQMKRLGYKGILYEYSRKHFAAQISKINKGRKHSEETRAKVSSTVLGTLVVRDPSTGKQFRTSVNDPRYLSGELVSYRVGRKHKIETKQKMSENNGIRGKTAYHQGTHVIYISNTETPPSGYVIGAPKHIGLNMRKRMKNSYWVTLKDTGKYKRIPCEDFDESIHIRGRVGFKGFKYINEKRKNIQ